MNLTLWILIIIITLYMILTVQASGSSSSHPKESCHDNGGESSSSCPEENSCFGWITGFFTADDYNINKSRAMQLFTAPSSVLGAINIWIISYADAILISSRTEPLLPLNFCLLFKQTENIKMPNIKPSFDYKTCLEWISLSGYDLIGGYNNFLHAQSLIEAKVDNLLSDCAHGYTNFVTRFHREPQLAGTSTPIIYESPVQFCFAFLKTHFAAEVSYKDCSNYLVST